MTTDSNNGVAANPSMDGRNRIKDVLIGEPLSTGYRPTLPLWTLWTVDVVPQFYLLRDIEIMMLHPVVLNALNYFKSGVSGAEFEIKCQSQEVAQFIEEQCKRYWQKGMPKLQGGYEYGWIGCEAIYQQSDNLIFWDSFEQFSPRDVYLLTQGRVPIGVRVKQIFSDPSIRAHDIEGGKPSYKGMVDLWMASNDVPAKGIWYAHNPRYSNYYGQSQLIGAWKPWRRLAWKDAAETVVDGGVYRFAYAGPMVRYPEEDFQASTGSPATTVDSQGNPRKYARDEARQMGEYAKAGAVIGVPSTMYPPEMGGGPKWTFEWPTTAFNVEPLIVYVKYLQDQICMGIGVPPELIQSPESGTGYSGRSIPLEGFMLAQQRMADALLDTFVKQILRPLIYWNFGEIKFDVRVRNLMELKRKAQMGEPANSPPGQNNPGQQDPNRDPERSDYKPVPHDIMARDQGGLIQSPRPPQGQQYSMNDLITDRIRERVRRIIKVA